MRYSQSRYVREIVVFIQANKILKIVVWAHTQNKPSLLRCRQAFPPNGPVPPREKPIIPVCLDQLIPWAILDFPGTEPNRLESTTNHNSCMSFARQVKDLLFVFCALIVQFSEPYIRYGWESLAASIDLRKYFTRKLKYSKSFESVVEWYRWHGNYFVSICSHTSLSRIYCCRN